MRRCVDASVKEIDEHRLDVRLDYVNEQLQVLAERELGYARAAAEVIRRERAGLMSKKDRGPGGQLVAIEDEATGNMLTGAARDKAVAAKVRAGNTPNIVCLEAAGHLMQRCSIERGETRGGATAREAGAAHQIVEEAESRLSRRPRFAAKSERVEKCQRPPAGELFVVGNGKFPNEAHQGRVRYDGTRQGLLGNPFKMGVDGKDEALRDLVCECYEIWYEQGKDAYETAVEKGLPIECVVPGLGRVNPTDIDNEIDSLVNIAVELGKRVVLDCTCEPKRCHLRFVARLCNKRAQKRLDEKAAKMAGDCYGCDDERRADADTPIPLVDGEADCALAGLTAKGDSKIAAVEECAGTGGRSSSISERAAVFDTAAEKPEVHAELNGDDMETELDVSGEAADLQGVQSEEQRAQRRRDIENRLWRDRLRSAIYATDASEGDKDRVYEYWTGEYQLEFNETGEKCTDLRVLELLQRVLTPERVMQLSKSVKEKLATGLDEFNVVLVKQGGPELAKLFAESIATEVATFSFPTSWTTWHATLIPKPGKDRCKLSGWREIWIQAHLWKLVVGAILPECAEVIAHTRPWCNAGFEPGRGCPEQSAALRARLELHMRLRQPLHIYFQDYSVFFPSISRQLVAFILHELGVNTISVQILREVQDQVMGAFKTAGGPTELCPMLRGEPIGGVESPLFSLPVAALVQRALESYVPGSPLPDRRELRVAALQLWYADDGALADAVEGIIQTAVDIMILLSEDILGLKVGHDTAEASKSASLSWTWDKSHNEFIRGDGNKFKVPLGSSREDIELARAISYRYLGIDFDPELDMTKVEESYRARASAIVTMINNLGGGSCDQLSLAINTVWQGIFIFPARTIPFTEMAAKALNNKATKVLCYHGNRLRHSKIVGAFISGKCGGLGLRPVQSTMAAGIIDERARAFGGRRGEPARAVQLAAHLAFAASLGWDGPSHEAPTAFDFVISERWLPLLRLDVPSECVALHLAKLGLNWRGTGVAECAADARRAAARGEQAATKARLINMTNVTPSLRLHGLGINSLDELHAGCGELLSAERIELIYARPGWVWSDIDKAHVRRLLREVAGDARAMVALGDWRERGVRMEGEIALTELINVGRRRALSMHSRIAGILWCKDAGGGRLDERSYEVIFCGARRRDAVWLTRAQVLEGAARRDAARRDATTAVSSCGASAEHVEPNETDEVIAWMDEADVSRWEPNTFNCFLHRLRGPASAAAFLAAAGRSAGIEPRAAAARIELIDLLLLDYAALRAKGVCAKEVNLREDRAADKAGKHVAGAHTTAWSATCAAELRRANGFENRVAAVRVLPAPRDADGAKFTDALVEARYDGVAWNNGRSNGCLWRGWRTAAHVPSHFERAPMALESVVSRSFMRDREVECADEGALFANAYGEPLKVRIARDEAALIATDINLALMGEIGKIELACVARGRGGFLLVAAAQV